MSGHFDSGGRISAESLNPPWDLQARVKNPESLVLLKCILLAVFRAGIEMLLQTTYPNVLALMKSMIYKYIIQQQLLKSIRRAYEGPNRHDCELLLSRAPSLLKTFC